MSIFLLRHLSRRPNDLKLFHTQDYPKILKFSDIAKIHLLTKIGFKFFNLISRNLHWECYNYKMIYVSHEYFGSCTTDKHQNKIICHMYLCFKIGYT